MIATYFLPVETIDGTERVAGIEFIHDALLECTEEPDMRKLIQDTTDTEHTALLIYAISWNEATPEELERFNARVIIREKDADTLRAEELLTASPAVITQPEMWELMRILARRLGYDF